MYRHKTKKYRAAAVGAVLAAVLMLGFAGCDKLPTSSDSAATAAPTPTPEPEDLTVFAEGTTMDGIDISGMKLAEAEKVCRAAALKPYANINVTVKSGDTEMTAKGSELTVVDTLDITLTRLLKSRKAGDYEMTYCLTLKNFENELKQKDCPVTAWEYAKEGGILTAVWNLSGIFNVGVDIDLRMIPMKQAVVEVCEMFEVNPYRLFSENCVILACDRGGQMVRSLSARGIPAAVIGSAEKGIARVIRHGEETAGYLERPRADELTRIG